MRLPTRLVQALATIACVSATALAPALAGGRAARADDPTVPGELMVKLRSTNALAPVLGRYALTLSSQFGARPIYRLKVIGNAAVNDVLAAMALDPDVMIAESNAVHSSPEARNNMPWTIGDPSAYVAQWAPRVMRLNVAQRLSTGAGVRVAVLDTGVDLSHPMLAGRLLPGFDFVDFDNQPSEVGPASNPGYGHGTHVAGLIAMVAPAARIMPVRVLDSEGAGNAWVLAEAMLYAVDPDANPATDDGAHVINLSLGSLSRTRILAAIGAILTCQPAIPGDPIEDRSDPGYADDDARCANRTGAVIVAAAGNDGSDNVKEYPAAEGAYGLVSVGASDSRQRLAGFSNSGSWVDIAAPGQGITSAMPGGGVATWSGTSMAAPLVAGTAALLRAYAPTLPAKDLARRIIRNGSALCGTNIGQLDAAAALTEVPLQRFRCN